MRGCVLWGNAVGTQNRPLGNLQIDSELIICYETKQNDPGVKALSADGPVLSAPFLFAV